MENNQYNTEKFADDELILVTSSNHHWKDKDQIQINELPEEKMIWRESDSGTRQIVELLLNECGVLDKIKSAMELGSYQSIKSAVEADLGISILPKIAVGRELKFGTLQEIEVSNFNISRDLWMVQKTHRFKKTSLRYFIDFIRNYYQQGSREK